MGYYKLSNNDYLVLKYIEDNIDKRRFVKRDIDRISSYLGLGLMSITRSIKSLKDKGIIDTYGNNYVLLVDDICIYKCNDNVTISASRCNDLYHLYE